MLQCTQCTQPLSSLQDLGADDEDGQVKWRQQLCLTRARLRSTSVAVLQVHYKPSSPAVFQDSQLSNTNGEVIAWGMTKIMQVTCHCK